jgi:hypothetical protein
MQSACGSAGEPPHQQARGTLGAHGKPKSRLLVETAAIRVEAPGIEPPAPSARRVVESGGNDAKPVTQDDVKRRDVSASTVSPATTVSEVDAAVRATAKLAIDAGDYRRARALLDLLDGPKGAAIISLAPKQAPK